MLRGKLHLIKLELMIETKVGTNGRLNYHILRFCRRWLCLGLVDFQLRDRYTVSTDWKLRAARLALCN
jgi:hypothetical protein